MASKPGTDFLEELRALPEVGQLLTDQILEKALDVKNNLGECEHEIDRVIAWYALGADQNRSFNQVHAASHEIAAEVMKAVSAHHG